MPALRHLALLALALSPLRAGAETVVVLAASSLQGALEPLAAAHEASTGHEVSLSYDGSARLARQIAAGAPAAVFVSAAPEWMDSLAAQGLIDPTTRAELAGNSLALIAHDPAAAPVTIAPGLDLGPLLGPDGRLAIGSPETVPAGFYARAALESLGLWPGLQGRLAEVESARAALALVASGEAPLGIVFASDAQAQAAAGGGVTVLGLVPPESHPPIRYEVAATAGAGSPARVFLATLLAPGAAAHFAALGFSPAPP
jgi:molybdate transport system substrate-binding protein